MRWRGEESNLLDLSRNERIQVRDSKRRLKGIDNIFFLIVLV